MKWIVSRYNHEVSYIKDYTDDVVMYDRSQVPIPGSIVVHNLGSDIYDKFTYIIDHYDNLPDIALYTKANLFDYIKPREFEKIKDNKVFTPILSQEHHTYMPICYYKDGLYCERNDFWFLSEHSAKYALEISRLFKMHERAYNEFAPGSNYILPKENILQHPKALYEKLRSYLDWAVYPGDAQLLERNLNYLFQGGSNEGLLDYSAIGVPAG